VTDQHFCICVQL